MMEAILPAKTHSRVHATKSAAVGRFHAYSIGTDYLRLSNGAIFPDLDPKLDREGKGIGDTDQ